MSAILFQPVKVCLWLLDYIQYFGTPYNEYRGSNFIVLRGSGKVPSESYVNSGIPHNYGHIHQRETKSGHSMLVTSLTIPLPHPSPPLLYHSPIPPHPSPPPPPLCVHSAVVRASELPGVNVKKTCDAYFKVALVPEELFKMERLKSKVYKNNRDPVMDAEFHL